MPSFKPLVILAAFALLAGASNAHAQTLEAPDLSSLRVRFGPFYMNPTLALTNAGVDTNVFNEADDQSPKKDFTVTVTPKTDLWLPAGRTWLNGSITEDIVWYKKYSSERSANTRVSGQWVVPLTRVSFTVGADHVNTHERPGFEIDTRVPRTENGVNGAAEIRVLSKTRFGVRADRRTRGFDEDAVFLGTNLHEELNLTSTSEALTIRNALTPLTDLAVDIGREQDRFEFDHLRDSNSTQISGGLKFNRLALIKGGVQIGYRKFTPLEPGVPEFTGLTTAVDLTYVLLGSTRMAFNTTRDVQYSYDVNQPYYLQTGLVASVAQQIFGPVDAEGRVGAARLAYRARAGAAVASPDRVDHTRTYGVGIGYHLGQYLRLAFNLDQSKRESVLDSRTYHGLRYGTALTYGF
jgi:hypothetical protein